MAISLRGTPQSGFASNGDNVTLTFDIAPTLNDCVIVFGGHGDGETSLTAPDGYTEIFANSGSAPVWGVWYKFIGETPDTEVVCSGGGDVDDAAAYCCYVLSGVDSSVLDQAVGTVGPLTGTTVNCPSVTTQTDGAWVFAIAGKDVTDPSITGPSGYSTALQASGADVNDISTAGAYLEVATAGAEDPGAFTFWGSGTYYGITAAIKPGVGPFSLEDPPKGGRVKKRKMRYFVEIDGELFEAASESEATAILLQARELAESQAPKLSEPGSSIPQVKVLTKTKRPVRAKKLKSAAEQAQEQITRIYQNAQIALDASREVTAEAAARKLAEQKRIDKRIKDENDAITLILLS